jgi:hypothetical protein
MFQKLVDVVPTKKQYASAIKENFLKFLGSSPTPLVPRILVTGDFDQMGRVEGDKPRP